MKKTFNSYIIGGKLKGRKFEIPGSNTTRSTKNIIRESFFNTLQNKIRDKIFIEVFGGSGSMALEAVSRGAKLGIAIEKDRNSYQILQKNCKSLDEGKFKCIYGNSFKELLSLKVDEPCILYFDPPFSIRENQENIYEDTLNLVKKLPFEHISLVAIEYMKSFSMPVSLGRFSMQKTKNFGQSSVSYFEI